MKRLAAALFVAGGALLGAGASVEAYPINSAVAAVSDSSPAPGGSFSVTVTNCVGDSDVDFAFEGASSTDSCDDDGATATFTAPTAPGTYTGTATVESGDTTRVLSFAVTVEAATTTTTAPSGTLPQTGGGSSSSTTITIALVLLLAGAGMFGVASMRRRQATPA